MLGRFSRVQLYMTVWTVACQAPLSMEFSRQEHWSMLLCLPPGNLPNPGIKPVSLMLGEETEIERDLITCSMSSSRFHKKLLLSEQLLIASSSELYPLPFNEHIHIYV